MPNVNTETGIRYGVVSLHSLAEWTFDEFFYNGESATMRAIEQDALAERKNLRFAGMCPDCRADLNGDDCPECHYSTEDDNGELPDDFWDDIQIEEEEFELVTSDGLSLALSYLGGAPLVWVFKSPVTTRARLCSPCVPNAGDLDAKDPAGFECYDLPSEWYGDPEDDSTKSICPDCGGLWQSDQLTNCPCQEDR